MRRRRSGYMNRTASGSKVGHFNRRFWDITTGAYTVCWVAALKPLARRIPGAILLAFLIGVPLGTGIILVFQHYDPQSSLGGPFSIAKRLIVWSPMWAPVTGVMIWAYPKSWFTWSYFR
jgi:hypothetical protein